MGAPIGSHLYHCEMPTFCIFNPEHDLCLANGSAHYVPPESALNFARTSKHLMGYIYPEAKLFSTAEVGQEVKNIPNAQIKIIPWGWNLTLRTQLLKQGVPESLLPSEESLLCWRQLQHRSTVLPLQPDCRAAVDEVEVEEMIGRHGAVVMKAPWSGAGRGLRWVTSKMSDHDRRWMRKMVHEQRCVIVEPRREVRDNFALEYYVEGGRLRFVGFSLFESINGVYRHNLLLSDEEIRSRVGFHQSLQNDLECWLGKNIAPLYEGPLGVDYISSKQGEIHLTELNLRHTMGLVAHEVLRENPGLLGTTFAVLPEEV